MVCGQLLRRQGRTKIHIPLAYDRQRKRANLRRQPMVAGFTAALRQQARGAILAQPVQQPKYLTPAQADQRTRVGNTQSTRLNFQQYLKPAEFLLAHRHRRHGTPPETPRSGGVPFELCRGVSSLYCAYTPWASFPCLWISARRSCTACCRYFSSAPSARARLSLELSRELPRRLLRRRRSFWGRSPIASVSENDWWDLVTDCRRWPSQCSRSRARLGSFSPHGSRTVSGKAFATLPVTH